MSDNSKLIVDALRQTAPDLAGSISDLNSYADELKEAGAQVALYRAYEQGAHRAAMTEQMRKMLRLPDDDSKINDFNDNYCKIIIDKMAGRTSVSAIKLDGDENELADEWLSDMIERNDFIALQGMAFRSSIRDGDSYIMVDPLTLTWSVEPVYDGFSGIVAIFDGIKKTPIWACNLWSEATQGTQLEGDDVSTTIMKLAVYQPDRISFWKGELYGSEVTPSEDRLVETEDGVASTNEIPWPLDKTPIVHIVNQYDVSSLSNGQSELRAAIPLQDVLNRTMHSMVMASEFSAFRVKWSIGVELDETGITPGAVINLVLKDKDGNVITDVSQEMAAFLNAVRVGQFEETDMTQYTNQIDRIVREISQISSTPIYGVTAQGNLSGEALKQLEIGLIGKVERFQRENTDSIKELILLTAQVQNKMRTVVEGNAPIFSSVSVTWAPAEILDIGSEIETLALMREKFPDLWPEDFYREKLGALLQMSKKEVDDYSALARTERSLALETLIGAGGRTAPVI